MALATYIIPDVLSASIRFPFKEDQNFRIKFVNGKFSTNDKDLEKSLDSFLKKSRRGLFARVRKVNMEIAEQLVREHQEQMAQRGGVTGQATVSSVPSLKTSDLQDITKSSDFAVVEEKSQAAKTVLAQDKPEISK